MGRIGPPIVFCTKEKVCTHLLRQQLASQRDEPGDISRVMYLKNITSWRSHVNIVFRRAEKAGDERAFLPELEFHVEMETPAGTAQDKTDVEFTLSIRHRLSRSVS